MTPKDVLKRYTQIERQIEVKADQVLRLRELSEKTTGTLSPAKVQGGMGQRRIEQIVVQLVDLQNEMQADIERLARCKRRIEGAIAQVRDERLQNVLYLRYINGWTWERIAAFMHYSTMQVFRLHGRALEQVKAYLEA